MSTAFTLASPMKATIYIRPDGWVRPAGDTSWRLTQPFGPSDLTVEPQVTWTSADAADNGGKPAPATWPHFHRGIDIGNRTCGAPVYAAAAGKVTVRAATTASTNSPMLNLGITHGTTGYRTNYAHLADFAVPLGAIVTEGQLIGHMGNTGTVFCHLHFQLSRNVSGVWRVRDPWRRLRQNITGHPTAIGVNLRSGPGTIGGAMAPVAAKVNASGRIIATDGTDLGPMAGAYPWKGTVIGATWNTTTGNARWERLVVGGRELYVAEGYAVLSVA